MRGRWQNYGVQMELLPLLDRVVVRTNTTSEKTPSGLFIPDVAKEKPVMGKIIAIGEGKIENGTLKKKLEILVAPIAEH